MAGDSRAAEATNRARRGAALQTYGANLGVALISLCNLLVVARSLGPSGRGEVAFCTTIAYVTAQLSTLGVHQANSNLGGRDAAARGKLATNSVVLAMLFGGLAVAILVALRFATPEIDDEITPHLFDLALFAVPVIVLQTYLLSLLQSDYRFGITNGAWLVPPILNVTINLALALAGLLTVGTAVATWVGGQALSTLAMAWYVQRRWHGFSRPDSRLGRQMVGFGLRTHAGRVMLMGNYRLDQWLLGALSSARELGLYSVAVAWAEALFYLPTALAYVQRPDLVRAPAPDAARTAARLFRFSALVTALIGAAMMAAAPVLCTWIFGRSFGGSVPMLRLLVPGALGIVAVKQLGGALLARDKPVAESVAVGTAFVAMIGLDLLLIPAHGGIGASVASTLAYAFGGVAVAAIFCRTLRVPLRTLLPTPEDFTELLGFVQRLRRRPPAMPVIESAGE